MKKYLAVVLLAIALGSVADTPQTPKLAVTTGKPSDIYGITAVHYNLMYAIHKPQLELLLGENFDVEEKMAQQMLTMKTELESANPHVLVLKIANTEQILGFIKYTEQNQTIEIESTSISSWANRHRSTLFNELESRANAGSVQQIQASILEGSPYCEFLVKRGYVKGEQDSQYTEERYLYVKTLP